MYVCMYLCIEVQKIRTKGRRVQTFAGIYSMRNYALYSRYRYNRVTWVWWIWECQKGVPEWCCQKQKQKGCEEIVFNIMNQRFTPNLETRCKLVIELDKCTVWYILCLKVCVIWKNWTNSEFQSYQSLIIITMHAYLYTKIVNY